MDREKECNGIGRKDAPRGRSGGRGIEGSGGWGGGGYMQSGRGERKGWGGEVGVGEKKREMGEEGKRPGGGGMRNRQNADDKRWRW